MSPEKAQPVFQIDRYELKPLIDKELEWMAIEEEIGNSPDPLLSAIVRVRAHYKKIMLPETKRHIRKVIVIYTCLIASNRIGKLHDSLRHSHSSDFIEFESFAEDLSDMTEPWHEALTDATYFMGDLDGGTTE
jgi:hypothetical protein